jgi:hypothetical protein
MFHQYDDVLLMIDFVNVKIKLVQFFLMYL